MLREHLMRKVTTAYFRRAVLGLALLAALVLPAGCQEEKAETSPSAAPLKVVVALAGTAMVPLEFTVSGTLAAKETVEVRARVSGYLAEKLFEEGASVEAGQVLYRLDDRDLVAALESAKADTARAKAAWENADTTRERMVALADKGSISLQQRDTAVAKAEEALAAYQGAQADEGRAAIDLDYATITAPTNGLISRSNVDVGGYVDAGGATLLATIYRVDPIRAEFSISDKQYAQVQKDIAEHGDRSGAVTFTLSLGDDQAPYPEKGLLEMADPVIDGKTNTMGVRVEFPNPSRVLRPGMFVNVTAAAGEREVVVIPEVAVVEQATSKAVYTVDENNTLVAVPVTLGRRIGENRVVESGLEEGRKVVVEGLVSARPGLAVEVVVREPAPASAPAE